LKQYLASRKVTHPRAIIDHLEERLFAVPVPEAAKERIQKLMAPADDKAIIEGLHALCTLPEFQLA
jgi:hypothetical protein